MNNYLDIYGSKFNKNPLFQIWVWHTRTTPPDDSDFEPIETSVLKETNLGHLSDYW